MALAAAQGNQVVALALIGLSAWKTAARDKCSTNSGYFQCWYDSSPSDYESWANTSYAGQSRTSYMLALQMILLSRSTLKVLDADLKFKREEKAEAKEDADAAPAEAAPAPKDGPAPKKADPAAPKKADPAAPKKADPVAPSTQHDGKKYDDNAQSFETVDGKNGRLVLKNGDVLIIKDGKIVSKNGKPYRREKKEDRKEKKDLEKEQKARDQFAEEKEPCTGWLCL